MNQVTNTAAMANPSVSQKTLILNHMKKHGDITQLQALELYRVHRLASRIHDLRKDGVQINANTRADATKRLYKSYSLKGGVMK